MARKRKLDLSPLPKNKRRKLNSKKSLKVEQELHCICRTTYEEDSSDMIQCSFCSEWFHVHCINTLDHGTDNKLNIKMKIYDDMFDCPLCYNGQNEPNQQTDDIDIDHNKHKKKKNIKNIQNEKCDINDIEVNDKTEDKTDELIDKLNAMNHQISSTVDEMLNDDPQNMEQSPEEAIIVSLRERLQQKSSAIHEFKQIMTEYEAKFDKLTNDNKNFLKLIEQKDATINEKDAVIKEREDKIKELQNEINAMKMKDIGDDEDTDLSDDEMQNAEENDNEDNANIGHEENTNINNLSIDQSTFSPTDWWQCPQCAFENVPNDATCQMCRETQSTQQD